MSSAGALAGVLAPIGKARDGDLAAFSQAKLELIRLRAQVNPLEDLPRWYAAGAKESILHLLSPLPAQHSLSINSFVEMFSAEIESYLTYGGRFVEVHDEPNRRARGAGVSWQDGISFSAWFSGITDRLRARFGHAIKIGFPAFAPSKMPRPHASAPLDEASFLNACRDSLSAADWAALHIYWDKREQMRAYDGALTFLRHYLERFPEQDFFITEYANITSELSVATRAQQYREFLTLVSQYPQIMGACGLLLRSNDPDLGKLSWINAEDPDKVLLNHIANRPELPDPQQLWFTWPTESRTYIQRFGESQRAYTTNYGLSGGHNGVDLGIDCTSPETSPVYAAYPGTVEQVAMDKSGYTRHLRILGYSPDHRVMHMLYAHLSSVEVKPGMLVKRGDLLGWGSAATPHTLGSDDKAPPCLHFGLRIQGINIPATADWVNPEPYLNTIPRGIPAHTYTRTYILLPKKTECAWITAVMQATWGKAGYVVGSNPDDAGIGDLANRQVIAVNPEEWGMQMDIFFQTHYPGVVYMPLSAATPDELERKLVTLPHHEAAANIALWVQGQPRLDYPRTYLLLPPAMPLPQVKALMEATWGSHACTVGTSIDDAAIGDLNKRTVIAVLPEAWEKDLAAYYANFYPGVTYIPVRARTFSELLQNLVVALETT